MKSILKRDVRAFLNRYLSFRIIDHNNKALLFLRGKLDIIDSSGDFWGDFEITIAIHKSLYPHSIPEVSVTAHAERNQNWHISSKGECCLDIPHRLELMKNRGIELTEFYKSKIYPFFANYCFKKETHAYANGEYDHFDNGIIQFYREEYGLRDEDMIVRLIEVAIGKRRKVGRNEVCSICGGLKFKNCCGRIVESLQLFGQERLLEDFSIFDKLRTSSSN